eukprot:gb/GFBE01080109.1/.p1 GENE.gb/GFBE01080109.1/~~gb/GFBE01080109.1/.p1  ORF type:complete len:810 (+),score=124.32 gb/GFBE01080109.1/:1-2430(+)
MKHAPPGTGRSQSARSNRSDRSNRSNRSPAFNTKDADADADFSFAFSPRSTNACVEAETSRVSATGASQPSSPSALPPVKPDDKGKTPLTPQWLDDKDGSLQRILYALLQSHDALRQQVSSMCCTLEALDKKAKGTRRVQTTEEDLLVAEKKLKTRPRNVQSEIDLVKSAKRSTDVYGLEHRHNDVLVQSHNRRVESKSSDQSGSSIVLKARPIEPDAEAANPPTPPSSSPPGLHARAGADKAHASSALPGQLQAEKDLSGDLDELDDDADDGPGEESDKEAGASPVVQPPAFMINSAKVSSSRRMGELEDLHASRLLNQSLRQNEQNSSGKAVARNEQNSSKALGSVVSVIPEPHPEIPDNSAADPDNFEVDFSPQSAPRRVALPHRSGLPRPSPSFAKDRTSLDALRANQDAALLAAQQFQQQDAVAMSGSTKSKDEEGDVVVLCSGQRPHHIKLCPNSFSLPARVLLSATGVLDHKVGKLWRCVAYLLLAVLLALVVILLVLVVTRPHLRYVCLTSACGGLGAFLGISSMRNRSIGNLLGPSDRPLDLYAHVNGFLDEFRTISRQRFVEVLALWACMIIFRMLIEQMQDNPLYRGTDGSWEYLIPLVCHVVFSLPLVAVSYLQLHVCCGLELAIDSFCLRLFDDADIDKAIIDWNVLQAMLRKAATQIDGSFFFMGTACMTTLVLLAQELMQAPYLIQDTGYAALWLGWVYQPVLLFMYTVVRAAAITEKCSRVAPLVNSWDFVADADEEPVIMHLGRQYIVQYIINSGAGFYVKGVRLTAFLALKLNYFFGAISFALISQALLKT